VIVGHVDGVRNSIADGIQLARSFVAHHSNVRFLRRLRRLRRCSGAAAGTDQRAVWRRMISWMLKGVALSGTDNSAWSANAVTVESMMNAPCTRQSLLQAPCLLPNQRRQANEPALASAPRLISSVFAPP
jgi:hypothetical protein